jgi:hypothetical protein
VHNWDFANCGLKEQFHHGNVIAWQNIYSVHSLICTTHGVPVAIPVIQVTDHLSLQNEQAEVNLMALFPYLDDSSAEPDSEISITAMINWSE